VEYAFPGEFLKDRVLIVSPNSITAQSCSQTLVENGFETAIVNDGKNAQITLAKQSFQYLFLDVETTNYSCLEVMRFIQLRPSSLKVFCTYAEEVKLKELGITDAIVKKFGIKKMLHKPNGQDFVLAIKDLYKINVKAVEVSTSIDTQAVEATIIDSEFTKIKIDEVLYDSVAAFAFYIRLGTNRYVKIINKGEKPSHNQIQKYSDSGSKHLYFLTKDRGTFISYQNDQAKQMIKDGTGDAATIVKTLKTVADKYIEEVYVEGLRPALVEEGKAICQNMFDLTQKDTNLRTLLGNLEDLSPTIYSHSFLVCMFTTIISKDLQWVGTSAKEALSIGALFHDIGLLQLPEEIKNKLMTSLTDEELVVFHQHPSLGKEALNNISLVTNMTKEIVLQHHETEDGRGFPYGLTGLKIYPMAKIVGLADTFADLLIEKRIPPKTGIKEFLSVRENLMKYDSVLVRNLVKGFVANK
jgi:HD-GYP domain-containing protein (c-di-GMP phosphodiesterase class II)/CheY-like chemotaxis protein